MAKLKNRLTWMLALVAPIFGTSLSADDATPKSAGSEKEASEEASGSLSAGAIAAAVAAAAAIAAVADDDDSAPAPTPAPTYIVEVPTIEYITTTTDTDVTTTTIVNKLVDSTSETETTTETSTFGELIPGYYATSTYTKTIAIPDQVLGDVEEEVTVVQQVEVSIPVAGVTNTSTSVKP
ncbi:hypothetical protein N9507_00750 [Gammaproteobacteria bacterium]|nr:hypothetical protein [Gammaproteobacteria bacterium]